MSSPAVSCVRHLMEEYRRFLYSLRVENLPKTPLKPGQLGLFGQESEL